MSGCGVRVSKYDCAGCSLYKGTQLRWGAGAEIELWLHLASRCWQLHPSRGSSIIICTKATRGQQCLMERLADLALRVHLYRGQWFSNSLLHNHLEGLLKQRLLGPTLRVSDLVGLG